MVTYGMSCSWRNERLNPSISRIKNSKKASRDTRLFFVWSMRSLSFLVVLMSFSVFGQNTLRSDVAKDFMITEGVEPVISIEVKLSSTPSTTKSFTTAKQDLGTMRNYIVAPVLRGYPLTEDVQVVSVSELIELL